MIFLIAYDHRTCATDIDYAEFAALGEEVGSEDLRGRELQVFIYRDCAAGDDTVKHGVYHVDLVSDHHILHEVLLADALGVVVLRVDVA